MSEFQWVVEHDNTGPLILDAGRRYRCGKSTDCDLVLEEQNVSRVHALLEVVEGEVYVEDQNSTNGVWINGERVGDDRVKLNDSDEVLFGDSRVHLSRQRKAAKKPAPRMSAADVKYQDYAKMIHEKTLDYLDLHKRSILHKMSDEELRQEAYDAAKSVIEQKGTKLPKGVNKDDLIEATVAEAVGLGPLEPLLDDETVTEIMVNRHIVHIPGR